MPRRPFAVNQQTAATAARVFQMLPPKAKWLVLGVAALAGVVFLAVHFWPKPGPTPAGTTPVGGIPAAGDAGYLFCFWNVENLFDDNDDNDDKRNNIDDKFDNAFAGDEHIRTLKYEHLATALLKMNEGRGPDILACAEVESVRAGELLQQALNKKLTDAKADESLQYKYLAMQNLNAGRHIAPCVISRIPVDPRQTKLRGRQLRVLEVHLTANGYDLCVLATHWTSQLTQKDGGNGDDGRDKYAVTVYERVRELNDKDVAADVLVCGDFNSTPDSDPVVKTLGSVGDRSKVKETKDEPLLLNLMADKKPSEYGTIWYNGKPLVYDQIVAAPGMLDPAGWSLDPDSVATVTKGLTRPGATRREPWRFDDPTKKVKDDDRGYSDHFPVTVRLKVAAAKGK